MKLALLLLVLYTVQTYRYVRVWSSELSVAEHVYEVAPWKPRAALNYGRALLLTGQYEAAARLFSVAEVAAQASHVPRWDRVDAVRAVTANRLALTALQMSR